MKLQTKPGPQETEISATTSGNLASFTLHQGKSGLTSESLTQGTGVLEPGLCMTFPHLLYHVGGLSVCLPLPGAPKVRTESAGVCSHCSLGLDVVTLPLCPEHKLSMTVRWDHPQKPAEFTPPLLLSHHPCLLQHLPHTLMVSHAHAHRSPDYKFLEGIFKTGKCQEEHRNGGGPQGTVRRAGVENE